MLANCIILIIHFNIVNQIKMPPSQVMCMMALRTIWGPSNDNDNIDRSWA